jgi:hypothetical protein
MKTEEKRKSACNICGKRLSSKTPSGDIQWQPSQINDKGIYCADCYAAAEKGKTKKDRHPQGQS